MVELAWPFAPQHQQWPFPGSLSPSGAQSLWSEPRHRDFSVAAQLLERPVWLSDPPPEGKVSMWKQLPSGTKNSRRGLFLIKGAHRSHQQHLFPLSTLFWLMSHVQNYSPLSLPNRNTKNHVSQWFSEKCHLCQHQLDIHRLYSLCAVREATTAIPSRAHVTHSPSFSGPVRPSSRQLRPQEDLLGKRSWRNHGLHSPHEHH